MGLVVAPVSALAAFSDVRVVGVFGNPPAAVTSAYQLRTAEIDPSQIRTYRLAIGSDVCRSVPIPTGKSFMIRTIEIDAYDNPEPAFNQTVYVHSGPSCELNTLVAEVTPQTNRQTETIPIEPGIPVPAGGGISAHTGSTEMIAAVHVTGYLMPAAAVPADTPITQAKGTAKLAGKR